MHPTPSRPRRSTGRGAASEGDRPSTAEMREAVAILSATTHHESMTRFRALNGGVRFLLLTTIAATANCGSESAGVGADDATDSSTIGDSGGDFPEGVGGESVGNDTSADDSNDVLVDGAVTPSPHTIAAGGDHSCAILSDATVECWGRNLEGQLGFGTISWQHAPSRVSGLTEVVEIAAGGFHNCALLADHSVRCWGRSDAGQLGNGTTAGSDSCRMGDASPPMQCWPNAVSVIGLSSVIQISLGELHSCALHADGTVSCWGSNADGQLGDGTTTGSSTPKLVPGVTSVSSISAGGSHTCVLFKDGAAKCWGANDHGQLGDGMMLNASAPPSTPTFSANVAALSAGPDDTFVVMTDGTVEACGMNGQGELGDGTTGADRPTFAAVIRLAMPTIVAPGNDHTCALSADGSVRCWGSNVYGQLAEGTTTGAVPAPTEVPGLAGVTEVASGANHLCVRLSDGTVRCWGNDDYGQIGIVSTDSCGCVKTPTAAPL